MFGLRGNMGIYFLVIFIILCNIITVLADRKCDSLGILLYEDMACTQKAINKCTGCPTEFDCPHLKPTKDECYYKNNTYKIGELVKHPDDFCDFGCFCQEDGKFGCPVVDCAEYFGIPPTPGCYRTYDLSTCCSNGEACDESPETCEFDGVTYKIGERFFPKKSCSMCVCQKGFRGKIEEPFCTPRKCNVQLKRRNKSQQNCAPLYRYEPDFENHILCCPSSEWICPNGTEVIRGHAKSDKSCFFGEQTLKVGQSIERNTGSAIYGVAICECKIPPLLTCIPKKYYPST